MSKEDERQIQNLRQTSEKAAYEAIGRLIAAGLEPTPELMKAMARQMATEQAASDKQNGIRRY